MDTITITRLPASDATLCEGCGETPTLWVEGTTLLAECGCAVGMWEVQA